MKVLQYNIGDIREWDSVGGNDFILHIQIVKILQLISPLGIYNEISDITQGMIHQFNSTLYFIIIFGIINI